LASPQVFQAGVVLPPWQAWLTRLVWREILSARRASAFFF
jgi:hypothetical protein